MIMMLNVLRDTTVISYWCHAPPDPVLKHCYCEQEYKNSESKKVHQKGSKNREKKDGD